MLDAALYIGSWLCVFNILNVLQPDLVPSFFFAVSAAHLVVLGTWLRRVL